MPEKGRDEGILPGETTITSSSDEAIKENLAQITRELHGITGEVVEGDSLPPKVLESLVHSNAPELPLTDLVNLDSQSKLKVTDSAFGRILRNRRLGKLKKAA